MLNRIGTNLFSKKLQKFPRLFQSGKWCKDNSFSHPFQIFRKIFSNELFQRTSLPFRIRFIF